MRIGAHVSAAAGLWNAPLNAAKLELETFQFFSRPPQGGKVNPIAPEDAQKFKDTCKEHDFSVYYIHAPYIINLASQEARIRHASIDILRKELERGTALGARAMMFHPGSASGATSREEALGVVADGIKEILKGYDGSCRCLIEISAGAGAVIGDQFEEVGALLKMADHESLGVCFDTAHAFASGYDLRDEASVAKTMKEFQKHIPKDRLLVSHCNDSKVDLGARKDRHEHLGKGFIGKKGFQAIVDSPAFKNVDLILETEPEDQEEDVKILKKLRG